MSKSSNRNHNWLADVFGHHDRLPVAPTAHFIKLPSPTEHQVHYLLAGVILFAFALPVFAVGIPEAGNAPRETHPSPAPASASQPTSGNTALVRIERFDVKGNTLLDAGMIERLLAPFKGEARSYTDIQLALEALEGAYRAAGYSAVHVITPEQEITEGVITFKVIETMVGKVILSGNEHYDKANIRNALPALAEGFTPSARELSANVRLANENPTRQLDVVLSVGEEENTVDARVNVQDSPPHKIFLTLDNTGNQNTGMYRAGVGFQHNNLFNRDHAATLSYTTSPNHASDVKQVSASYRIPIYATGDSIDLMAAHSDTDAGDSTIGGAGGPLLSFSGKGNVYGIHYNHYLPRRGEYTSKIVGGFDYRATTNNCLINGVAGLCGGSGQDITVHPVSVAYNGALAKPTYVADFTATLVRNIPGGANGGTADVEAVRPGAKADYTLMRLNGSLSGILPQNWQYRLAGNAQYSRDALLSTESFGLVGANAVRGFVERELSSEKGYVLNAEIYSHDMAPDLKMQSGSLRLLWFIDRAQGWGETLPGEAATNRISVGSTGVGLRFTYSKNLTARLDYASVNQAGPSTGTRAGDKRGHLSIVGSW